MPNSTPMQKTFVFLIFLFVCLAWPGFTQGTLGLSLEASIQMAQSNSPAARVAGFEMEAASRDYDAFHASLLPRMELSANAPGLTRSINNLPQDDGSLRFVTQSQSFSDLSLNISQGIPLTGGRIRVFSGLSNITNFGSPNSTLWQTNPLVIGISQPLFQLNTMKWDRRQESMRYRIARINYTQTLENEAVAVTEVYFDALIAQVQVQREQINVLNNDTIFDLSQGRFSVGKIAENELLQSELNLMNARAQLARAELDYDRSIQQLRTRLGLPLDQELKVTIPVGLPPLEVDPDLAASMATEYSTLAQEAQWMKLNAARNLIQARRGNGFSANINATFGLNQTAASLSDAFSNPVDRETFSVGISMPIFQWGGGRAQVDAAYARERSIEENLKQQQKVFADNVYYQAMNLTQLRMQLELSARSDTIALRRYDITKSRYLVGKVAIQDLYIAQQEKDAAQQVYISNLQRFWMALAQLRASTLYDFVENHPILVDQTLYPLRAKGRGDE